MLPFDAGGYGTNEFNFEKLENPPSFEPKRCSACGKVINLGTEGYSQLGDSYTCEKCNIEEMNKIARRASRSERKA